MRFFLSTPLRRFVLLALLASGIAPAFALEPQPRDDGKYYLYLTGWVDVSATGELSSYDVETPRELAAEIRDGVLQKLNAHDIVSRRPFGARPNTPRWVHVGAKVAF